MTDGLARLGLGFSLILAIGSQDTFVLKQGILRSYVFVICLFCAVSDTILISAKVTGFGTVTAQFPQLVTFAKYMGAIFLLVYGLKSLHRTFTQTKSTEYFGYIGRHIDGGIGDKFGARGVEI